MCILSCVRLLSTPWSVAHQVPLPTGLARQDDWSGLPFPSVSPEDLPDPEMEPVAPVLASRFFTTNAAWKLQKA